MLRPTEPLSMAAMAFVEQALAEAQHDQPALLELLTRMYEAGQREGNREREDELRAEIDRLRELRREDLEIVRPAMRLVRFRHAPWDREPLPRALARLIDAAAVDAVVRAAADVAWRRVRRAVEADDG